MHANANANANEKSKCPPQYYYYFIKYINIYTHKQDNNANNHAASSHNRQELINQPKKI